MLTRPFDPGNTTEQETLLTLALAQEARLQARMPGLLASPMPEAITTQLMEAAHLLVVEDASGQVRGAVQPAVWHVKRGSMLRAFVAGCNGVAQQLILPDPQESDASATMETLLQALEDFWRHQDTDADLLRWPAHDTWFVPLLAGRDFLLDSICATRSLEPFFAVPPAVSAGLHLHFRTAQPSDESALLRLFHEELLFHERSTPFVRSSPAVLQAFGRKLERLWKGETFEDGAPLIVIAEQGDDVIAMAENTLATFTADDEPGFTPPGTYWCIDNVSVLEPFHGQGIGRVLLQTIESMRLTLGLDLAGYVLWYNPDNTTAAQFWSRRGFLPVWTTYQRRKVWEEA
ncbi:MAG TPA: GNAT family N-acetyltransferase [Ktedonobacteraceae bacterium]|nr:GNAT family N-acetyltransferase [Ktedonobacteraceae bacterium]